ncbi:MAG TPA: hypothetical protein VGL08_22140 [Paraburkholderia sp.]|jgi:hypothetical protein
MKSTTSNETHNDQHFKRIVEYVFCLLAHAWHNRYKVLLTRKPQREADQGPGLSWWASPLGAYSLAELTPALIGPCRDELAGSPTPNGSPAPPPLLSAPLPHFRTCLAWL